MSAYGSISPLDQERYLRHRGALAKTGQEALAATRLMILGLGGLGGFALEEAARLGFGLIVGVDGDVFEESNLNRQILADRDTLGRDKVEVAAERAAAINPFVEFLPVKGHFSPLEMRLHLADVDLCIDCLGGAAVKRELAHAAADVGKTVITGAVSGFAGWAAVVRAGDPSPVLRFCNSPACSEDMIQGCPAPTVGFAASLMTAWAVREVVAPEKSEDRGRVFLFDLFQNRFDWVRFSA